MAVGGSNLVVAIEDRGLGIANTENLFVPFYTTKPTGSGVGLALAQQIARAHGGEIRLLNREDGEGARAIGSVASGLAVRRLTGQLVVDSLPAPISVATMQLRPLFLAR